MKITSLLILILFLSEPIIAQTEKGNFLINGSVGFGIQHRIKPYSNIVEDKSTYLSIVPVAGYFFIDNIAAGLQLNYYYFNNEIITKTSTGGLETLSNTGHRISGGPFIKWYIPLVSKVSYFTNANGTFYDYDHKDWQISAEVKPGFALFITSKIGIELSTTLLKYDYRRLLDNSNNNLFLGLNLNNTNLGVSFYL